jgi:hypothetical protein
MPHVATPQRYTLPNCPACCDITDQVPGLPELVIQGADLPQIPRVQGVHYVLLCLALTGTLQITPTNMAVWRVCVCVCVQIGYSEIVYTPYRSSSRMHHQNPSGRFTPTDL